MAKWYSDFVDVLGHIIACGRKMLQMKCQWNLLIIRLLRGGGLSIFSRNTMDFLLMCLRTNTADEGEEQEE